MALLKFKAEQEALESQRQLEEARQKAAQVMWPFKYAKIIKVNLCSTLLKQLTLMNSCVNLSNGRHGNILLNNLKIFTCFSKILYVCKVLPKMLVP